MDYTTISKLSFDIIDYLNKYHFSITIISIVLLIELTVQTIRLCVYSAKYVWSVLTNIGCFFIFIFSFLIKRVFDFFDYLLSIVVDIKMKLEFILNLLKVFYYKSKHINDNQVLIDERSKKIPIEDIVEHVPYNWEILSNRFSIEEIVNYFHDNFNKEIITIRAINEKGYDFVNQHPNINWDMKYLSKNIPISRVVEMTNLSDKLDWSVIYKKCTKKGIKFEICSSIEKRDQILRQLSHEHPVKVAHYKSKQKESDLNLFEKDEKRDDKGELFKQLDKKDKKDNTTPKMPFQDFESKLKVATDVNKPTTSLFETPKFNIFQSKRSPKPPTFSVEKFIKDIDVVDTIYEDDYELTDEEMYALQFGDN